MISRDISLPRRVESLCSRLGHGREYSGPHPKPGAQVANRGHRAVRSRGPPGTIQTHGNQGSKRPNLWDNWTAGMSRNPSWKPGTRMHQDPWPNGPDVFHRTRHPRRQCAESILQLCPRCLWFGFEKIGKDPSCPVIVGRGTVDSHWFHSLHFYSFNSFQVT